MNPLYIDDIVTRIGLKDYSLVVYNGKNGRLIHSFKPRSIEFDSIVIQKPRGSISFAAIDWCIKHAISVLILDWKGNTLAQIVPDEPASPELRLAQCRAYDSKEKTLEIVKQIIDTKIRRQWELIKSLSPFFEVSLYFKIKIKHTSLVFIRNTEARYANVYFEQYGKICKALGHDFELRRTRHSNQHASDLVNSLLNYGYAILKAYVRRAINSAGLDNSISFLHYISKGEKSLTFDLMELWRPNIDNAVLQTLERLPRTRYHVYEMTDNFEARLSADTIKLLCERIRLNLSQEEIIFNVRQLAKYMIGENKNLSFNLKSVDTRRLETTRMKDLVMTKTAKELGMNKSSHWYQKKRLKETGAIRIYNKTRTHFV